MLRNCVGNLSADETMAQKTRSVNVTRLLRFSLISSLVSNRAGSTSKLIDGFSNSGFKRGCNKL